MKNSIISTGGRFSTARMLVDYTNQLYIPLCNLYNKYCSQLDLVSEYEIWKKEIRTNWDDIVISQEKNAESLTIDAGNEIEVYCKVKLPNISQDSIEAQVYYGQFEENGTMDHVQIIPMKLVEEDDAAREYHYMAKIELTTGGNFGYTFRVMPKHEMLLDSANLDLIKWMEETK